MADTKIEWCDKVWNPVTGCTKVSQGCKHCYAERIFGRNLPEMKGQQFNEIRFHPERLEIPLRWRKPRLIFVNSMSDLFHDGVPFHSIDRVFAMMSLCKQHTFMVLTKRPRRMYEYLAHEETRLKIDGAIWNSLGSWRGSKVKHGGDWRCQWPLPNVWLGVSTEDQKTADERIEYLRNTPAAVRFLSAEPLLGEILLRDLRTLRINWVICGGESGPGARPMNVNWARSLRDQCKASNTPFFFKQWGQWAPPLFPRHTYGKQPRFKHTFPDGQVMWSVGKKRAGCLLDGVEWKQFPEGTR